MSQSTQFAAQTFTRFPDLPVELQLMIYTFMTPEPRRVHMTFREGTLTRLGSSTPIPALLHLNRDARHEALKKYKLRFGTSFYEPNVFFNPKIDTLFFGPDDSQPSSLNPQDPWPCHNEFYANRTPCRRGCGHHELDFFLKNIAKGSEDVIRSIGIDLRFRQADLLHFFYALGGVLLELKKAIAFHPTWDGTQTQQDSVNNEYPHGWKFWGVCGVVDGANFTLEVEEFDIPGMSVPVVEEVEEGMDEMRAKTFREWLHTKGLDRVKKVLQLEMRDS